jgi:hypothetical protein
MINIIYKWRLYLIIIRYTERMFYIEMAKKNVKPIFNHFLCLKL